MRHLRLPLDRPLSHLRLQGEFINLPMIAILSDIHGNRPALEAVFAEMEQLGLKRMLVLGDVIGYGPFPNDCLRMVAKAEVCLQGNHEAGVIGSLDEQWFNDAAWGAIEWTRKKLTHADRELISKWRPTGQHEGIQLAYASLNPDAVFDYLLTPRALKAHFAAQKAPLCFVGHTHVPEIWTEGREGPVAWPKSGSPASRLAVRRSSRHSGQLRRVVSVGERSEVAEVVSG